MKYLKFLLPLLLMFISCGDNSEWKVLFDGENTDKLRGYKMEEFPLSAWEIVDGAISTKTGVDNIDIVTKNTYKDFELTFEWKVSKAGNSGVFYHLQEVLDQEAGNGNSPNWMYDFEFQIQDDIDFPNKEPIRSAGSLYGLIAPENKVLKPVGEYNTAKLVVKNNHAEHWINGKKVVEYVIGSNKLNELLKTSKFKDIHDYGKPEIGHIMFQHHGQKVWYKNIKIRKL